jgi:DNA-binding transcriptional MerR regulator
MSLNNTLIVGLLVLIPLHTALANTPAKGCEGKRIDIEQQIDYARAHDNNYRVAGLQKALAELNTNCTDEGLKAERQADIRKKERKVEERRRELSEAKVEGRERKIRQKQKKLQEAQEELTDAKEILNK